MSARLNQLARSAPLAAYGLLGLPLAMSALPVYVQVPVYYSQHLGLALAGVGWVLFFARLIDTFQDPLLGRWIDVLQGRALQAGFVGAARVLALAFYGLWLPPTGYLALWLAVMLVVAYTAHSMLNIAYLAWGAKLDDGDGDGRGDGGLLGAAAWREGAGLFGVIVASVLPSYLLTRDHVDQGMAAYSMGFAVVLALGVLVLLRWAPAWRRSEQMAVPWRTAGLLLASNQGFARLLLPYFLNAISVSIPATLALFFINDRLGAPQAAGVFLALYFMAAAIGLPAWVWIAKRLGVLCSWRLGMALAILSFCGASMLGQGDVLAYGVVCIAAGLALGADLALPPVLLAKVIPSDQAAATYYGVWTLLGKLALAMAGLALPVLAWAGYQPGQAAGAELAWMYAGVPCAFKLAALLLLQRFRSGESS